MEHDTIRNKAKRDGEEIHFGRVHGIMVEKRWQLQESLLLSRGLDPQGVSATLKIKVLFFFDGATSNLDSLDVAVGTDA